MFACAIVVYIYVGGKLLVKSLMTGQKPHSLTRSSVSLSKQKYMYMCVLSAIMMNERYSDEVCEYHEMKVLLSFKIMYCRATKKKLGFRLFLCSVF